MFSGTFSTIAPPTGGGFVGGSFTAGGGGSTGGSGGVSLIPSVGGGGSGTFSSGGSSGSGTFSSSPAPAPAISFYYSASQVPSSNQTVSQTAYSYPGLPSEGTEFSSLPSRRLRGLFGEDAEAMSPLMSGSLLNNRKLALLTIGVFGFLLLKD